MLTQITAKENNFIKAVLNSGYRNTILDVYKSPYVVSKLAEAGYEMDPRAKDSDGLPGLFYALTRKDPEILYKLYYFAVDNCCQTEVSFRNPDPNVVLNLQCIEELLLENMSKLKDSKKGQQCSDIETKFGELLRLNTFILEYNRKILEIKNRLNYYESTSDNVFEAIKRKDVIVSLLDIYKKFFKYEESSFLSSLDDYIFHKGYYLLVDMIAAIIFFDNITFLKERLKLENDKQFSEIESSFFFFSLCNLFLLKLESKQSIKVLSGYSPRHIYIFPLIYRFDTFNNVNNFGKALHEMNINEDNVVNHIPESEIYSILHSYPNVKNMLEMIRLDNYIKTCKNIRVMDVKSVLVIERVLQVIGESIAAKDKDDFSFKRILSLCFPKEIAQTLRRLRHELTHLKGHAFPSKIKCETNASLFRSILSEIRKIANCFRLANRVLQLSFQVYFINQIEKELQRIKKSEHLILLSPAISTFTATEFPLSINFPIHILKQATVCCHNFFKMALVNLEDEIEKECISSKSDADNMKHKILNLLCPVKWFLELLQKCDMKDADVLLQSFSKLESSCKDSVDSLKERIDSFIKECYDLLPKFNVVAKKNRPKKLKSVPYIEYFMKVLKGFVFLTNEEKDEIRKEIPEKIKEEVSMKDRLIQSVNEGFTWQIDSAEFELSYLSRKKMKNLRIMYESKDAFALTILESQDPIAELEEIFTKNCVDKKKYDKLCDTMQFTEKAKKLLGKLVAGQRKKIPANNLINLLHRIQLLRTLIIDEDEEIQKLWFKIKREKSRQLIDEKIVRRYLKDRQFQVAVEMLLFDCMILFEGLKLPENLWIKSSKLYQGINIRNVISHGNPLVENVCLSLDPQDLPSEIVKKILILIKGEDAIKAILELHESVNNNFTKLLEVINCDENDDHSELRGRIKNCNEWKYYTLLLPDTHREKIT